MKTKVLAVFIILMLCIVSLVGCNMSVLNKEPVAADDEVLLIFNLDTQDKIYQVSMDYLVNGEKVGDAGIRNADGTPLSENDGICHSFSLNREIDISKLSLQLYTADFVNDFGSHEEEYKIENEIKLTAEYGKTYYITIAGNKESGYTAFLKTAE